MDHDSCNRRDSERPWRPTRVIDIGLEGNSKICPRLLVSGSDDWDSIDSYTTLSHRWGKTEPMKLLKGNIQDFQSSISFDSLPRKYQDAMKVTRQMAVRYLWIDTLCIIQDSEVDWLQEAALMGPTYSNSYCNITAALPASGSEDSGCFFTRDTKAWESFFIFNQRSYPPTKFHVSRWHEDPSIFHRGWVFQERLLCPSTLIFGKDMLWECRETFSRELSYALSRSTVEHASDTIMDFKNMVAPFPKERLRVSFQASWKRMIGEYSNCQFTVPGDKLVALSGIASALSRLSPGDEYLAGLWKSQLPQGLLWYTLEWQPPRPVDWRAPTWSWASAEGYIAFMPIDEWGKFQADYDQVLVEIHDAFAIPVSGYSGMQNEEFGPVKGACLVLNAPFAQVKLSSGTDRDPNIEGLVVGESSYDFLSNSTSCEVRLDSQIDSQTLLGTSQSRSFCMNSGKFDYLDADQSFPVQLLEGVLYCVSLLHRPIASTTPLVSPGDGIHGLLLNYHEERFFTRAGIFSINGDQVVGLFKSLPKTRVSIF